MYTNKCIKCGCEFETKNPKRVICPNCLYPERKAADDGGTVSTGVEGVPRTSYNSYSAGSERQNINYSSQRMSNGGNYNRSNSSNYSNQRYNKPYSSSYRKEGGNSGGYRNNSYNAAQRPYGNQNSRRPQQRPYNNQRGGGGFKPRYNQGGQAQRRDVSKRLLITKEQMIEIENLYKAMLPLPNHDAYEVIAEKLSIEPRKVFFGINLIRQKLMLPKLNFPKRKLAVTEDQVFAIKNLYEPLLPLPPIGCHKIIAAQLKMDEWRVHVGIGVVRRQMGLERWNMERTDIPESLREKEVQSKIRKAEKKALEKAKKAELKRKRELENAAKEAQENQTENDNLNPVIEETQDVSKDETINVVDSGVTNDAEEVKNTATTVKKRVVKKAETSLTEE